MFCWGSNELGQCGRNDDRTKYIPSKDSYLDVNGESNSTPVKEILQVSCGTSHTAILTSNLSFLPAPLNYTNMSV